MTSRGGQVALRPQPAPVGAVERTAQHVIVHFTPNQNRATNVPVTIQPANGEAVTKTVNQQEKSGNASLGKFKLGKGKSVTITISNKGTNGHVIADGVQLLRTP